jgi:hypothetical protein
MLRNNAQGGSGVSAGEGIGGGLYIDPAANVGGMDTFVKNNHASTSDDDIFGTFKPTC